MSFVTRALVFFIVLAALAVPAVAHAAVHTVSAGETLYAISRNYGISLDSLMQANNITATLIHPGQKLYVPVEEPASHPDVAAKSYTYTVRKGDNLYVIGQKFGVNYGQIMSANGLSSTTIYPGMTLYIPGISGEPPAMSQPAPLPAPQVSRGFFQRPSPSDVDLLARLITAEADAEPYEGKVAVGAVVLNRLYSQGFPKTIPEVIYQNNGIEYQFQPVQNGLINQRASDESVEAAKEALGGVDPSGGALYFFANYSKNPWLWSRPVSRIIGNTIFAY